MGKVCPIVLISIGGIILLLFGILTINFNGFLKTSFPKYVAKIPVNEILGIWMAIPTTWSMKVNFTSASTSASTENFEKTTLARGHLDFLVELSKNYFETEDFYPVLWMQKDGEIGELNRAVQVYSEGQLNWTKVYGIGIGLGTCGFAIAVLILGIIIPTR